MSSLCHTLEKAASPERVVILGAGGFIGRTLVERLEREKIHFLALKKEDFDCLNPTSSEKLADLLKPTDALVVLATITPSKGRGVSAFVKNILIAENICKALEKQAVGHIVYISADPVYSMDRGMISETSPVDPSEIYGAMHLSRELMIKSVAGSTPVAILRSTLVYGAEDPHNSYGPNRLRRMAHREGKISLFGKGEEKRDHIFVEDVVSLIFKTLQYRSKGILNLASGNSISYWDLAQKIAEKFKKPVEIVTNQRMGPITHRHFDPTNVFRAFPGFTFTPLDEGLQIAHNLENRDE